MIDALRTDGFVSLPAMPVRDAQCVFRHLHACPTFEGHVKGGGTPATPQSAQTSWDLLSVLSAPHVLDFALPYTELAGEYLQADPLLYSVNAFTMHPVGGRLSPDTQEFHRDRDDKKFLALFIYLTDVWLPADGAHQYQRGTHGGQVGGEILTVLGDAGTAFLADTYGLHRGMRPATKPRTILWVRWGVSDPPQGYVWDRTQPVQKELLPDYPSDLGLQQSIRLVAA
jgi:hypothetical protein